MNEPEKVLCESGIIAIVRGADPRFILPMAEALYAGGIRMMEVTMNTDGAEEMIGLLREREEGRMVIGAGTVTHPERLDRALRAGAQFIVTPNLCDEVVTRCVREDILITPGVMTPSEICRAAALGCRYVKLFPAGPLGAAYLKAIRGPLSDTKILVVGGISADNLEDFLAAGAFGAGVGGSLCRMNRTEDAANITAAAEKLISLRAASVAKQGEK